MVARLNQGLRSLEEITDEMHLHENVEGEEKYLHALTLFASLKSDLQLSAMTQADHNMATLLQQQSEFFQRISENGKPSLATPPSAAVSLTENLLPKIHIQPFGGDYKKYPALKDIYERTVHKKTYLGLKGPTKFALCYWIAALSCPAFLNVASPHLGSHTQS